MMFLSFPPRMGQMGVEGGQAPSPAPAGGDLVELQPRVLAPGEEPAHLAGVGGSRVGVGDPRPKELIGREAGRLADAHKEGRESPFKVGFGRRIFGSESEFPISHNS